jgi:hypothetical protein
VKSTILMCISVLLIPCDEAGALSCEDSAQLAPAATQTNVAHITKPSTTSTQRRPTPRGLAPAWRARLAQRYHFPCLGTPRE